MVGQSPALEAGEARQEEFRVGEEKNLFPTLTGSSAEPSEEETLLLWPGKTHVLFRKRKKLKLN